MRHYLTLAVILCIAFAGFSSANEETKECDKSKCPGPLKYYEDLKCTPVYKNPGDCCAIKYNCDHLKSRDPKKCYINDHEYAIGEALKDEDRNPCDIGCTCVEGQNGVANFVCAIVDCFAPPSKPGCYKLRSATDCCASREVCPEKPEDRPTCLVDGKTYLDGEYFVPKSEPEKTCYCGPNYKGENVEPFCMTPKHSWCGTEFRHAADIHDKCAPVYYSNQSPQTSCSVAYRCQNNKDAVIRKSADEAKSTGEEGGTDATKDPTMTCEFGNMTLALGDELSQATDYSSVCVKCTCEVPPVPTCQRLPDQECDVTVHPPFNN